MFFKKKKANPFEGKPVESLEGEIWIIAGKKLGERWTLIDEGDEFLVGRHLEDENDISYENTAQTISKKHCIIRKTGTGFELEDLGSANGTFVNKKKVEGKIELVTGDEIVFGLNESTAKFTVSDVGASSEAAEGSEEE